MGILNAIAKSSIPIINVEPGSILPKAFGGGCIVRKEFIFKAEILPSIHSKKNGLGKIGTNALYWASSG